MLKKVERREKIFRDMQQQKAGSQFVVPHSEMAPFSPSAVGSGAHLLGIPGPDPLQQSPMTEAASPISSRTPARPPTVDFDELAPAVAGNCPEDQSLAGGEDAERGGGATGNRWPRQETLALLKIRSEMDAAFRDATFKGSLWEEVCRYSKPSQFPLLSSASTTRMWSLLFT